MCLLSAIFYSISCTYTLAAQQDGKASDCVVHIGGYLVDSHNDPVPGAWIQPVINGRPYMAIAAQNSKETRNIEGLTTTSADGAYQVAIDISGKALRTAKIGLDIRKPNFEKKRIVIPVEKMAALDRNRYIKIDIQIKRIIEPAFWIATGIFLLTYIFISLELLHRTLAAMLGASLMLIITYTIGALDPQYHIISYEQAIRAIDMNVVFLLMGMMIIVGILKKTGVFQWCAYKTCQLTRGKIFLSAVALMSLTATISAFLDNVTTMLLLTPIAIEIAVLIGLAPMALLIPLIFASNIGGTATLIGDPPNIMIGSYTGLTFMDFARTLTPIAAMCMLCLAVFTRLFYRQAYRETAAKDMKSVMARLRMEYRIKDRALLIVGMAIMSLTIGLFMCHGLFHMEVSIAALFGASLLLTYAVVTKRVNLLDLIRKDIEWATLLFFIFLFIIVGAVQATGLLAIIADKVLNLSHGGLTAAVCLILWVSAVMSAIVDNIPFTATMLPVVAYLTKIIPGAESGVLWWALAVGACLGGNGTPIGASANVVTIGIAETLGYRVRFFDFIKGALTYMIISVAIANICLVLFY